MRILLRRDTPSWYMASLSKAIKKLDNTIRVPVSVREVLKVASTNADASKYDFYLDFQETEGSNCVALFGMWYDLGTKEFSLTRSDTVTGIKLFTIDDLYKMLGYRVPQDVNDKILEYKATGKLDVLFNDDMVDHPVTYLQFFLLESSGTKKREPKEKVLENLVKSIKRVTDELRWFVGGSRGKLAEPIANNMLTTTVRVDLPDEDKVTPNDLYASSVAAMVTGKTATSSIKAAQALEIVEAESVSMAGGYLDPVLISVESVPTFKRITSREKSSIKVSLDRNIDVYDQRRTHERLKGDLPVSDFRRALVEISKCASKSLGV